MLKSLKKKIFLAFISEVYLDLCVIYSDAFLCVEKALSFISDTVM